MCGKHVTRGNIYHCDTGTVIRAGISPERSKNELHCWYVIYDDVLLINHPSLAWPDPFRTAAYRSEIISAALQGSGIVREHDIFDMLLVTIDGLGNT